MAPTMFSRVIFACVACLVVACGASGAPERAASAFPPLMCVSDDGCGHCEACAMAHPHSLSGTCSAAKGCY